MDSTPPTKLRFMVSTGGHILPRPHDKSLRYIGGKTHIIVIPHHTTLQTLTYTIFKTLFKSSSFTPTSHASLFTLKYQLPSEDLDSLISLTTDEDLENMIDEYERLYVLNSSPKIRLFAFPTNSDPASIGSFLENHSKSEDWFLNALNGTVSGFSDTSSVNCLLDLDDEICVPEKKDVKVGIHLRGNNSGQDVHSIPDSGQETNSSFGSACSSTPSHVNLAPIVVKVDDHQLSVHKGYHKHHEDGGLMDSPGRVSGSPVSSGTAIKKQSDPFLWYHERSEQGHRQPSTGFDLASMDSIMSDLTITEQSSPVSRIQTSGSNNPNDTNDKNTRVQMLQQQQQQQQQQQKVHNSAYPSPAPTTQVDSPRHQLHHQEPQFIPPPQYIHHHHPHPPVTVPVTSYYQHHPHQPQTDQQNFMYYIPIRQPPQGYSFPKQQPQSSHADTPPAAATNKHGPQLVRVPSGYYNQRQHVGYSEIHQPTHSVYYATPLSTAQYQKMTSVSPIEAGLQEQQVRSAQP